VTWGKPVPDFQVQFVHGDWSRLHFAALVTCRLVGASSNRSSVNVDAPLIVAARVNRNDPVKVIDSHDRDSTSRFFQGAHGHRRAACFLAKLMDGSGH